MQGHAILSMRKQRAAVSLLMVLLISILIFGYVAMQIRGGAEQSMAQVSYYQGDALIGLLDSALERSAFRYKSTPCDSMVEGPLSFGSGSISVDSAQLQNTTCVLQLSASIGEAKHRIEVGLTSSAGVNAWSVGQRAGVATRSGVVWQLNATTYTNDINDLYCFDNANCWVAGDSDILVQVNNSVWSSASPASGESYRAIACNTSSSCFVAGSNGSGDFIRHWNGSDWNSISYISAVLRDIQCPSSTICYAVGDGGLLLRYDGSWNTESSAIATDFNALACTSASECWAVTSNDKKNFVLAHRSASSVWQTMTLADNGAKTLRSIACSNGVCWAAGDNGAAIHYVAGNWSYYGKIDSHAIYGLSCRDADDACLAVGNNGTVLFYDGSAWLAETSATNHALNAVMLFPDSAATMVSMGLWRELL